MITIIRGLKKTSIGRNLLLIVGASLAGIVFLISMALFFMKQDLFIEREDMTRHLVQAAHSIVVTHYEMAVGGRISHDEAKASVLAILKGMKFGENDFEYFWVNDMQPKMVMHPVKPELQGKDMSDYEDPSGKRLFMEFVETVKKNKAGFVYYLWPKPGFDEPVMKVSYVMGFEPWGWIIGSGMYLDDVHAHFWGNALQYAVAGLGIFSFIVWLSVRVARKVIRNEEALKMSEEKFFKAFHACPDGIGISRKTDGMFIDANEALLGILGYSREETINHTSLQLNLWVDLKERAAIVEEAERGRAVRDREVRLCTKRGIVITILWASDVIRVNDEEYLLVIIKDITAQKESHRQLLKSKAEITLKHEQLSTLFKQIESAKTEWEHTFDCIYDMVILLDLQGKIRRCNRAAAQFGRLRVDEIIGLDWHELFEIPDTLRLSESYYCFEWYQEKADRWYLITCYPYSENGGNATSGAVLTVHDTTDTKRAALEVQKANAELHEAQAHMLHQEKMASVGQLAAGVAHEINNPIGFIMSNLSSLGKYADRIATFLAAQSDVVSSTAPAEAKEELAAQRKQLKVDHILADITGLLAESLEGAERVKKIVQDLKSFSRVDEAELKYASLTDCIDSTINIVWNELKYKATLVKEFNDIPMVKCYPQKLNQVFMNLLMNAAHAIEKEGKITVTTRADEAFAYVSITDTGCGIDEKTRLRIFEPFFTTKEVGQGTGLGLSISYDIVKKHGGEITLESTVGKGTTFTVRLPLSD